jgi:hypothetical protein
MSGTEHDQPTVVAVYRTLPARIIGWGMVLGVLGIGFVVVRTEVLSGRSVLVPVAIVVSLVSLVWVVLLRPDVELRTDGVVHRNLLSDTLVPFSRLQEVGHRWALELVDTAGRKHSSWAVPKQREFSARRRFDDFAETTARRRARPGTTAIAVADDVQREWQRWRLAGGRTEEGEPATRTWAWAAVVPLVVSAALLVLAVLLG